MAGEVGGFVDGEKIWGVVEDLDVGVDRGFGEVGGVVAEGETCHEGEVGSGGEVVGEDAAKGDAGEPGVAGEVGEAAGEVVEEGEAGLRFGGGDAAGDVAGHINVKCRM